jgi:hypothetical protein
MQGAVHVGVGHASEELGLLLTQLGGGDGVEGDLVGRGSIGLEDTVLLPFLLILLFDSNQRVSLLSLLVVRIVISTHFKELDLHL